MTPKEAVEKLAADLPNHGNTVRNIFEKGNYRVVNGSAPEEYNESYSEICWGWLATGPQTDPIVAAFGRGERGNDEYNENDKGLVIYVQGDDVALKNANLEQAAKGLISKEIGFGEFKAIVRDNF